MSVPDGFVSVEAKDIEVTKTINDHQFDTLAVVMNIRSSQEDAVRVTVTESLPAGSTPDDIWFHSEYGGEHWDVSGNEVTFTRAFEPDESFTTVYGTDSLDQEEANLLSEPAVTVEEGIELGEVQAESESEDQRDPLDNLFEETTQTPEEPKEKTGIEDSREANPSDPPGTPEHDEVSSDADEGDDEEVTVPVTGGIGRVLAKELRNDRVSTEDRELIRESLAPGRGSVDARIEHLREALAELEGYTEDLEEFLDNQGGAAAVIESLEDDIAAVSNKVEAVTGHVGEIEDRVGELGDEVDTASGDIGDIRDVVEQHSTSVGDIDDRVDGLRQEVETLDAELERVDSVGQRIDTLESDIDSFRDELAELRTFRDRLTAVVGPGQEEPTSRGENR